MSQMKTRSRIGRTQVGGSRLPEDEYFVQYLQKACKKYRKLLTDFELRCHRAALINYKLSSSNFETSKLWELVSFLLGGAITGGLTIVWHKDDLEWYTLLVFAVVTIVTYMLAALATHLYRSRTRRANDHTKAGAAWQMLAQTAQSYLVQLDDPQIDIQTISQWYDDLVKTREKTCVIAVIPSDTYNDCNKEEVFEDLRGRKEMLTKYQEEFSDDNDD